MALWCLQRKPRERGGLNKATPQDLQVLWGLILTELEGNGGRVGREGMFAPAMWDA